MKRVAYNTIIITLNYGYSYKWELSQQDKSASEYFKFTQRLFGTKQVKRSLQDFYLRKWLVISCATINDHVHTPIVKRHNPKH